MRTLLLLFFLLLVSHAAAAAPLKYTLVTSSGPIGGMTVTRNGNRYDSQWRVDDNGRGARLDEHIMSEPGSGKVFLSVCVAGAVVGCLGRRIRWVFLGDDWARGI